jgi:hypothetical protein
LPINALIISYQISLAFKSPAVILSGVTATDQVTATPNHQTDRSGSMATLNSTPTNVVTLPRKSKAKATKARPAPRMSRQLRRMQTIGYGILGVAMCLTVVSLVHTAGGVMFITGGVSWECWLFGFAVEASYLSLEVAKLTVTEKVAAKVGWCIRWTIAFTMLFSAATNAVAFAMKAPEQWTIAAAFCGIVIPFMILTLSKVSGSMILSRT